MKVQIQCHSFWKFFFSKRTFCFKLFRHSEKCLREKERQDVTFAELVEF